jgi:hypothetical protein
MDMTIDVITDVSGSMSGMAKSRIAYNAICFIAELPILEKGKYGGVNFCFFNWGSSLSEIGVLDGFTINTNGKADFSSLAVWLKNATETRNVLLLSDGHFSGSDISSYKKALYANTHTVAIGADADEYKLEEIAANGKVYRSEDIALAIDDFFALPGACPEDTGAVVVNDVEDSWDA